MLFLMRENIFPTWEDINNKNGACFSFKIPKKFILNEWNQLLLKCITENIDNNNYNNINGISISPKKEYNIIKIWIRNKNCTKSINYYGKYIIKKNSLFKIHSI